MKSALACGAVILALTGCHPPSVTEQRLIGTWRIAAAIKHHRDRPDELIEMTPDMEITLTADHKEVWRGLDVERQAVARWHLEGNDLVFTMETEGFYGPPGTTRREKITKISADELVFSDGTNGGRWTRVR
jgi:hypothetical protein